MMVRIASHVVGGPKGHSYDPLVAESEAKTTTCCGRCCRCYARYEWCLAPTGLGSLVLAIVLAYRCHFLFLPPPPAGLPLIDRYLGGRQTWNWWNLPAPSKEQSAACRSILTNTFGVGGLEYGMTSGVEAVQLAFECTKVPGLFERVPEPFRGVFWMQGNALNEELAVLHYGEWFEEERILLSMVAPFSWAWAAAGGSSGPANAPLGGLLYNEDVAQKALMGLAGGHTTFTTVFEECPGGWRLPFPFGQVGSSCTKGSGNRPEMTFARMHSHVFGNLTRETENAVYTMEAMDDGTGPPGNKWHRGIFGSVPSLGGCPCISVGSYDLLRILDGDGRPVEPYYSQFLEYIGSAPLSLWHGYTDPSALELLMQERLEEGAQRMWESWCEGHPERLYCSA